MAKTKANQLLVFHRTKSVGGKMPRSMSQSRAAKVGAAVQAKRTKKRRFKSGTLAIREIRKYQKSVEALASKAPMNRMIREALTTVCEDMGLSTFRISPDAMEALRLESEAFLVELMREAQFITIMNGRVTLGPKDIKLRLLLSDRPCHANICHALDFSLEPPALVPEAGPGA